MVVRGEVRARNRDLEAAPGLVRSTPDEEVWAMAVDADQALNRLNPDLRAAFEAVAIEGMSIAEAAQLLGVPEGTVKSRVHRARQIMQEEIR